MWSCGARLRHQPLEVRPGGDIGGAGDGLAAFGAQLRRHALGAFGIEVGDHDTGALAHHAACDRRAESRGCARDDGCFLLEFHK